MSSKTAERNGGRKAVARADDPDLKWAVEWLVRRRGQRRAASLLGVDRKTVALALRRERLTPTMTYAVQTLMAGVDDPEAWEAMPLDRMEAQIGSLLDDGWKAVESLPRAGHGVEPETISVNGTNGNGHNNLFGIGPTVELAPVNGHHANILPRTGYKGTATSLSRSTGTVITRRPKSR